MGYGSYSTCKRCMHRATGQELAVKVRRGEERREGREGRINREEGGGREVGGRSNHDLASSCANNHFIWSPPSPPPLQIIDKGSSTKDVDEEIEVRIAAALFPRL